MAGSEENTLNFGAVEDIVSAFADAYTKAAKSDAIGNAVVDFADRFTRFVDLPNSANSALEFVQRPQNFRDQVAYGTNGQLTVGENWDRYRGTALNESWFGDENWESNVIVDQDGWAMSYNRQLMGVYSYALEAVDPDAPPRTVPEDMARQIGLTYELGDLPAGYQEVGRGLDSYGNANPLTGGIWNDYDRKSRDRTERASDQHSDEVDAENRSNDSRDRDRDNDYSGPPVRTVTGTGTNSNGDVVVHTKNTYDNGASYTYSENKNTGVTTISGETRTGSTISGSYNSEGNGSITSTGPNGSSVTYTMSGHGMDMPVILDLDGDGVEVNVSYDVAYDIDDDGFKERTTWAAADDGFLVIDLNANGSLGAGDGKINQRKELILADWGSNGMTDLQALARAKAKDGSLLFDSNGDGHLTSKDKHFGKFKVWQDRDQDGRVDAGELKPLAALKITSINLTYDNGRSYSDERDNVELGTASLFGRASFVRDGKTFKGGVGDIGLGYEQMGTKRTNFDGGYSIDHEARGVRTEYHRIFDGSDTNFNLTSGTKNWVRVTGNDKANSLNASDKKVSVALEGKGGNDVLRGGRGDDHLRGGSGADKIYGGSGKDVIITGIGNDFVDAGGGNDVIISANFQGRFNGGSGIDTIDFSSSTSRIVLRLYDREYNDHIVTMSNIENVIGSDTRDDSVSGDAKDNTLTGLGGDDVLSGREGHDTLSGGHGNDRLYGSSGNDNIFGGRGNDKLYGGTGNDNMVDGYGHDLFDGSSGFDVVSYTEANKAITADLGDGTNNSGDTYKSIEGLIGSGLYDDKLFGSDYSNLLVGAGGDDELHGRKGNDSLFGDTGDDTLYGGDGDDELNGGIGNDRLYGGSGTDVLKGGGGDDYLRDDSGKDKFHGGSGSDTVSYYGHKSGMTVNLATGNNSGGDTYTGIENVMGSNTAADKLTGDAKANNLRGLGGDDILIGGDGDDRLYGGGGSDILKGGTGDDYLRDDAGRDRFEGGSGSDTVSYLGHKSGMRVNLTTGANNGGDVYVNIENLLGSETAADNLTGTDEKNILSGSGGADVLWGLGGADVLKGGTGADKAYGGAGADSLHGDNGDDYLHGGDGDDRVYGGSGHDTLIGGVGDDYLRDDSGKDTFNGGSGNDTVSYYGHNSGMNVNLETGANSGGDIYISIENVLGSQDADDRLIGSNGVNVLNGSGGNDVLYGRDGGDTLKGEVGSDRLYGEEGADTIHGGDGNDFMHGGSGADRLYGGKGDDTLNGGAGDDYLRDDGGKDTFIGGEGTDTVSYFGDKSGMTVNLGTGKNSGGDTYSSIESVLGSDLASDDLTGSDGANVLKGAGGKDTLYGAGGNDKLYGGTQSDTLFGGSGDDYLNGESGTDILQGGTGTDTFHFDFKSGRDLISDFEQGLDLIELDGFEVAGVNKASQLNILQAGSNVVIEVADGHSITVQNTIVADVEESLSFI